MKSICLIDINSTTFLIESLFSIIEDKKPDIIMCLGGLFYNTPKMEENGFEKSKQISTSYLLKNKLDTKKLKTSISEMTLILEQLAIFNLPIVIIPSKIDLQFNKAVKRAKNTENLIFRWLNGNQFTTIEGYVLFGFSETQQIPKIMENYFFESNVIWCLTDNPQDEIEFLTKGINRNNLPEILIFSDEFDPIQLSSTFSIRVPSLKDKKLSLVDFEKKTNEFISL